MKILSEEEALAAKTLRHIAAEASMDRGISAKGPNCVRISRLLHEGKPIPDDLLPGRFLEFMKERLTPEECESLKSLTSDLTEDRLWHD